MIFYDPDAQAVCANNGVTKGREQKPCQKQKNSLTSRYIEAFHYINKCKYKISPGGLAPIKDKQFEGAHI
jgi:uncharacterized protein (DUF1499 family)